MLQHRITPLGYIIGLCLILAMALRLGSSENTLFSIIATLAAMLLFSFVSVFFRRGKLSIQRSLPKMGTVGIPLHYTVTIETDHWWTVSSARLRELPARNIPSEDVFVYSVEPGEESRNAFDRLFVLYRWKWLTDSRQGFYAQDSHPIKVSSKSPDKVRMEFIPKRRGVLPICNMRVLLPDPLFLFQRCVGVKQTQDSVLVLPKRYKIDSLKMLGEAQNQVGGEAQSRQIGQSSEFVSLRGYRPGDPLKHVDWKSWAKTGQPVVREYEDVYFPRHGLVLDTGVHPTLHEEFEEAVSVAASFACSIETNEGLLDLVMMQQQAKVVTVGKGVEQLDHMMEVLACAEMETRPNWNELITQVCDIAPDFSGCIMVFADWDRDRCNLLNRVVSMGVTVVALLVYNDEKSTQQLMQDFTPSVRVHLLKAGQVQKGLDQALESLSEL